MKTTLTALTAALVLTLGGINAHAISAGDTCKLKKSVKPN